jgi:hypothetical protein
MQDVEQQEAPAPKGGPMAKPAAPAQREGGTTPSTVPPTTPLASVVF